MGASKFSFAIIALSFITTGIAIAMEPSPGDQAASTAQSAPAPKPPARIFVKYRNSTRAVTPESAPALVKRLTRPGEELKLDKIASPNAFVLSVTQPKNQEELNAIAARIAQDNPDVEYAEAARIMQIQQVNDPLYPNQWDYHFDKTGINVANAWETATGRGVVVAVIDTGIRPHQDLAEKILPGYSFISDPIMSNNGKGRGPDPIDPGDFGCPSPDGRSSSRSSWHGTHVAGSIAAVTNNGIGVSGVARDAMILPIRALGRCGGSSLDIADAILWAGGIHIDGVPDNANPAKVINMSLGGTGPCGPRYTDVIQRVRSRGVIVVVAAGNSDSDASNFSPASCEGVITVAATNRAGARAYFGRPQAGSNFGRIVKIAAPGGETYASQEEGILSTLNTGTTVPGEDTYQYYQGTSMATPHVAGVAALLAEIKPAIAPDEILIAMQRTAQPFPSTATRPCTQETCGAGIIDAGAAVSFVRSGQGSGARTLEAASSDIDRLAGQWLIGESGEILRINQEGAWLHPSHGKARIRKANDAADIRVYYEQGSMQCSYRMAFSNGGKTLELIASDPAQDFDYCPEGSLNKVDSGRADVSKR
jgi:serine protease